MSSFSKLVVFPAGYFRATCHWLLNHRREVVKNLAVISSEIERIGHIRVYYRTVEGPDGNPTKTEERVGFAVTPNSTMEKLLRAYIAQGGNPYNISPFKHPDTHRIINTTPDGEPILGLEYPQGGVVAPKSVSPDSPRDNPDSTGFGQHEGGYLLTDRYYPARMGGRVHRGAFDANSILLTMDRIRSWANQAIHERLQLMEWKIIKQADLKEQLEKERERVLFSAFAGTLTGLPPWDPDKYNRGTLISSLIDDMNKLIFETQDEELYAYSPNIETGLLYFTFPDTPSEERDAMGG